jgi:hypothetical protein
MQLTDSEQVKLLSELYNKTTQKVEAVLKRLGLDKIPSDILAEVQALRKEQKERHKINLWQFVRNTANDVARNIDKLQK